MPQGIVENGRAISCNYTAEHRQENRVLPKLLSSQDDYKKDIYKAVLTKLKKYKTKNKELKISCLIIMLKIDNGILLNLIGDILNTF